MKLIYNNLDLKTLGTLRILGHKVAREPAEAPQRERHSYTVRLDFFEDSYRDNHTLIESVRAALNTQQTQLTWSDDAGNYINRTVTIAEDETVAEPFEAGGTYWQALQFTFWFLNHQVTTNCLSATYTRAGVGAAQDLGAVEHWEEAVRVTRVDELRSARRSVEGTVTASGRWQADTSAALEVRRTALLAKKDAMLAAVLQTSEGTLAFGTFNKLVKVVTFSAAVDQPLHGIDWRLSVTYVAYPTLADYIWLELRISRRTSPAERVQYLTLSGRMGAASYSAAVARLQLLRGSIVPTGYIELNEDITEVQGGSESPARTAGSSGGGDGLQFIEIAFTVEYRDTATVTLTYQRAPAAAQNLGTVMRYSDAYGVQLFDDLRPNRRRAGGVVNFSGQWFPGETLTDAQRQAALADRKAELDVDLARGMSALLVYGTAPQELFHQTVRVMDWRCDINRAGNAVEWSLTGSYTKYPNETDYALCEFQVGTRQDRTTGVVMMTLTGRIGAPSAELARAKQARLRTLLVPAEYVLRSDGSEERRVDVESGRAGGSDVGDGAAFIELTLNEEWQKTSGDVLESTVRRVEADDVKTAWVRTSYTGSVTARAASSAAAWATAEARATALGDNKFPFRLGATITETDHQFLTDREVILTVEFSYEYQRKSSTRIYLEYTSELQEETFGQSVETVSGFVQAPTLALAQATYRLDVRNTGAYAGALLLSEAQLTASQQQMGDLLGMTATGEDRFTFRFAVWRPKGASQTSASYEVSTEADLASREQRTAVSGTVLAQDETTARALLASLFSGLGTLVRTQRKVRSQQGAAISGGAGPVTIFVALDFSDQYVGIYGGVSGVLETSVSEDCQYSGDRLVEKPLPDAASIIQTVGVTMGRRQVSARAVATTEAGARAWVIAQRALLGGAAVGGKEAPPSVTSSFRFLPLAAGVARGTGANAVVVEAQGRFEEWIPEFSLA